MGVWNPDVIFNLINPEREYDTCTGHASTYGRRCRRRVAAASMADARSFLRKLATENPITASKSPDFEAAAKLTLCYQHKDQVYALVNEWRACIQLYAASTAGGSTNDRGASNQQEKEKKQAGRGEKAEADGSQARRKAEDRREEQQRAKQSAEQKEQEKVKAEQEHEKKTARQQQNSRQRAEEREAAEKQEWADAWSKYCRGWMSLETDKTKITPSKIPWPVKSGSWQDVSESSVRSFFRKAVPVYLADHQGDEMYRTICDENKRWHTDKIMSRFGPDILKGPYGDALNMIAKLMVQLRVEAKMGRKR
ncbi:putative reticulocyte-binding protein 2 like protein a protein [Achaetomium macrosporum]|uniref:Reticulocyte-binding protein 2 like protein a protein n=1 Tax=Achaetomium macrosporum TaxID=79813 RepID=A0AAN7C119_9PEZI|nr:putative reticulocyte-binding protein 2 like protein a protein [Achaetomium macrosporum]